MTALLEQPSYFKLSLSCCLQLTARCGGTLRFQRGALSWDITSDVQTSSRDILIPVLVGNFRLEHTYGVVRPRWIGEVPVLAFGPHAESARPLPAISAYDLRYNIVCTSRANGEDVARRIRRRDQGTRVGWIRLAFPRTHSRSVDPGCPSREGVE